MKTVVEYLRYHAENDPNRLSVVIEKEQITYKELWNKTKLIAAWFYDKGLQRDDRIVVRARYSSDFIAACFAAHLIGAVFVPIDINATAETLVIVMRSVSAKLALTYNQEEYANEGILYYNDLTSASGQIEVLTDVSYPHENVVADIMFTTGTTGNPKGVMLTHKSLMTVIKTRAEMLSIKKDNVCITSVPLNHVAPMRELYLNIYNGSTTVFVNGMMNVKAFFEYMEKYKATSIYIPPAGIAILAQFTKMKLNEFADQIDYVYTGSAAFSEKLKDYMKSMLPHSRLYYSYGSSENGTVCLLQYSRDKKVSSCVGKACTGVDVRIVNEHNKRVAANEIGTITIKSDMDMKGYWNAPTLTASVFVNGYFVSNDVGYYDEDGFVYVTGRKDDVINIGGLKVMPTEIEGIVLGIDGIDDCICVAESNEVSGNSLKLLAVKNEGSSANERSISDYLRKRLDSYKQPSQIIFVEQIEKTSNGKVDRNYYRQNRRDQ